MAWLLRFLPVRSGTEPTIARLALSFSAPGPSHWSWLLRPGPTARPASVSDSSAMKALDPAGRAYRPEPDVPLTENVPVSMRDGVRMATDVYRPARAGRPLADRRPVLLHRTPYNKVETEATSGQCRFFASRGYVVVNQDCRGCFGSEGDVNFLIPEAEDGADTVAWIRKQEWCDGTVGTFGTSWSGWTQTALAALGPEGLATMVANMSGADAHESSVRHGGALELRFLAWAFWHSAYNTQAALTAPPHVQAALNQGAPRLSDWLRARPIRPRPTPPPPVPPPQKVAPPIPPPAAYHPYQRN